VVNTILKQRLNHRHIAYKLYDGLNHHHIAYKLCDDDIAYKLLGFVTCFSPMNILEIFYGVVLGFVSNMIDIS